MSNSKQTIPIVIVQGLQFGSEAKGAIAAYLCIKRNVNWAVRTGAVNAGHTVYWPTSHPEARAFKMQQLPTGWVNPTTQLIIGAGAYVHPEILANEIAVVNQATGEDVRERLWIDDRASLHLPSHTGLAKTADRHHLMGATGKGCSEAVVDKIKNRGRGVMLFKEWWKEDGHKLDALSKIRFNDTVAILHTAYDKGESILLEGTQGSALDLNLGPYPYTTHKPTQASQWVVEAGLSPNMEYEIVGVARTYPIRVAGNSGPMENETTWPNIARNINRLLMRRHMGQRVKSWAIEEFDKVWIEVARSGKYELPSRHDGSENYDLHQWRAEDRVRYRIALSELPADVMRGVTLATRNELENLFEFTTVTNKLRRVSEWNPQEVAWAAEINRVNWVALTFWNYSFPETWGQEEIFWDNDVYGRILVNLEEEIGCRIAAVSTGPLTSNIIETPLRGGPRVVCR